MNLLDTSAIRDIFGATLGAIYGDGQLIRVDMVQQPNHSLLPVEQAPVAIKVQVDRADEAMRAAPGYTETDVKLLILQSGISGREPNSDDIVVAQGQRWKLAGVQQDPARSHWTARGIRQATPETAP